MKRVHLVAFLASAIVVPLSAHGYEPPNVSVADALRTGRVAFVGRLIQLSELSRSSEHEALGLARFTVTRCLYGRSCNEKVMEMEYTLETQQDRKLGVDFMLGENYLVVLKKDPQSRPRFGSDWADSMDIAFRLIQPLERSDRPVSFVNVWLRKLVQRVPGKDVLLWADRRKEALSRGE
jgi:hypothetical protein